MHEDIALEYSSAVIEVLSQNISPNTGEFSGSVSWLVAFMSGSLKAGITWERLLITFSEKLKSLRSDHLFPKKHKNL